MTDPLQSIREVAGDRASALRWACVLEATAPKVGNVHPGASFDDLNYSDFVLAAEIAADVFDTGDASFSASIKRAVSETVAKTGTNVNLGILLLLGPLVAADEAMLASGKTPEQRTARDWKDAITCILDRLTEEDSRNVYDAINSAMAGGLGKAEEMDLHASEGAPADLIAAMQIASSYDRVARQFVCGFADLIDNITAVVGRSIAATGDLLSGIGCAHLELLAAEPDSLIIRKQGREVAVEVQRRASGVNFQCPAEVAALDQFLRSDGNCYNPGTTADLIAASLYVLLRSNQPFFESLSERE